MPVDNERLSQAYEQLFVATAGQGSFLKALATLIEAFGSGGGVIFEMNRKTGIIERWLSPSLVVGEDAYDQHINSINPRMRYSLSHAPGHVAFERKFIDDRSIDRHEFYDWLEDFSGLRYFMGSRIYDDGDLSLFHSLEFDRHHGHPDRATIDAFARSARVIGNAWRVAGRASDTGTAGLPIVADGGAPGPWTPDHLPWSIFAVSRTGDVVQMNARARALVEAGGPLRLNEGRIEAVDRRSASRLTEALRAATGGASAATLIDSGDTTAPLVAQALPLAPTIDAVPHRIAVLLYVWNPALHGRDRSAVLARLWGFTASESRLAETLCRGDDLARAAIRLGISRNTARNQLQAMFGKTGTRRQAELMTRIMGVLEI